ncbi:MAG: DNA polymerase III subunit gamma/tau [Actinomycetota bacterium]|nr:DNA polymerase III subunit gamma/tau [Actinomycetota bacterium]
MAYLSLYRKYRPQTFEEILGQDHVSKTLANAISEDRVSHAYLFTGPRGTGKTSTARILAKALNCAEGPTPSPCGKCESCIAIRDGSSLDVIEMDAASHSKVDETREILSGVPLATAAGRRKVYVIDEVHMLSAAAFNALLKTLEEPPGHVVFVLATTEAHKVLPTIISRTQRFDFRRVSVETIESHLAHVAKSESIDADPDALALIAKHSDGSVRDALSILDQLATLGRHVDENDVQRMLGRRTEDALRDLFESVSVGDVPNIFQTLHQLVAQGGDARQITVQAIQVARSLLLLKTTPGAEDLLDVSVEDATLLAQQAEKFSAGTLLRTIDLLSKALTEMRNSPEHRLLLEIALVRAAAPETDPSANGLLGRIERLERLMGIQAEPVSTDQTASVQESSPAPGPDRSTSRPGPSTPKPRSEAQAESRPEVQAETTEQAPAEQSTSEGESRAVPAQVGLGHIRDAWGATMKEVSNRSKRVWGLLSPSRPVDFDGSTLTVEVQADFHSASMADGRNRDVLVASLHAALGISPGLEFTTRAEAGSKQEPEKSEADDIPASDAAAEQDPVELVKKGLSAEVIEEKSQ